MSKGAWSWDDVPGLDPVVRRVATGSRTEKGNVIPELGRQAPANRGARVARVHAEHEGAAGSPVAGMAGDVSTVEESCTAGGSPAAVLDAEPGEWRIWSLTHGGWLLQDGCGFAFEASRAGLWGRRLAHLLVTQRPAREKCGALPLPVTQ